MNSRGQIKAKFTPTVCAGLGMVAVAALSGCGESEVVTHAPPPVSLTIGGSVTGLAANGLILQLNGADDLAVNASGKFKFPKPLDKGSAYTVTVKASPTTPIRQTCTVAQGSGTLAGIAVNNVAVTCTTNNYAVGGTVSGLSGKVLKLQLNGTHDIEIAKNGNFLFPGVRLPDGSDYSVAIKATPAKQKCTIEPVNTAPDKDTINIVAVKCSGKVRRG